MEEGGRTDERLHCCVAVSPLKLPTAQAEGFLVGLHSPYPAIGPRARSARLSSRRTLAWRISALRSAMLLFRPLVLLLATCARFQTLLRGVAKQEKREVVCT